MGQAYTENAFLDPATGQFTMRTCFVKGTKIQTIHGQKSIEEIKAGDLVLSWNQRSGVKSYNKVNQTFIREANEIYTIRYSNGAAIQTTWSHRFWINEKGWVEAKDLKPGNRSPMATGASQQIESVTVKPGEETVYNFSVENDETYFAGDDGVLVHNDRYSANLTALLSMVYEKTPGSSKEKLKEIIAASNKLPDVRL